MRRRARTLTWQSLVMAGLAALATPRPAAAAWLDAAWAQRTQIRVLAAKVEADLVDFPVVVDLAHLGDLFFDAIRADGADVVVTGADGVSRLPRELAGLDAPARRGQVWFLAPELSASQDTVFFIYFGNAAGTEVNDLAAWPDHVRAVWHFEEQAGNLLDATHNDNDAVLTDTLHRVTRGQSGLIGLAWDFGGAGHYDAEPYHLLAPYNVAVELSDAAGTLSAWVWTDPQPDYYFGGDKMGIARKPGYPNTYAGGGYELQLGPGYKVQGCVGWHATMDCLDGVTPTSPGAWHHFAVSWTQTELRVFVDGRLDATRDRNYEMEIGKQAFMIGERPRSSGCYFEGRLDEIHVSALTLDEAWLRTEHGNQGAPFDFYRVGPQEDSSGATWPVITWALVAPAVVKDGDSVSVDVLADAPGYTVTADFDALDSTFATSGQPVVEDLGGGNYNVRYTVSAANTRADGTYPIPLRATNGLGRSDGFDALSIRLDNTPPAITRVTAVPTVVENGEYVTVTVETDAPGYQVAVDFSTLDSTFSPGDEQVQDLGDGSYEVYHQVSIWNEAPDGLHALRVTVNDGPNTVSSNAASVTLDNRRGVSIQSVFASPSRVANGDTVSLLVTANAVGLTVTASFFNLDSTYEEGTEQVVDNGNNTYTVTYQVSEDNARADGLYFILVRAEDSGGSFATDNTSFVSLENAGTLPLGAACTQAMQCASRICVDELCCDELCQGRCERCDLPAHEGRCTPCDGTNCRPDVVVLPTDVTCDRVDDDCDGRVDDDYPTPTTRCGTGACASTGLALCDQGAIRNTCQPGLPADDDATCDGVNDDCDQYTDEDCDCDPASYLPLTTACGVGACAAAGETSCVNGKVYDSCRPGAAAASDPTCDGVDDDCDDEVDEDYRANANCGVGACRDTNTPSRCENGVETPCLPGKAASVDTSCDDVDDDCDGEADDDYAVVTACGFGACRAGATPSSCVDGVETPCQPRRPLTADDADCDGADDDCDGFVDEDAVLGAACGASDPCAVAVCSPVSRRCEESRRSGCCAGDADCQVAGDCVTASCDLGEGRCQYQRPAGCCGGDADCDDGLACTLDRCGEGGACTSEAVPGCCVSDADCDDGDPCSFDQCAEVARCLHTPSACPTNGPCGALTTCHVSPLDVEIGTRSPRDGQVKGAAPVPLLQLRLSNGAAAATLEAMTFTLHGLPVDTAGLDAVTWSLSLDRGGDAALDAADEVLAAAQLDRAAGTIRFEALAVDLAPAAQLHLLLSASAEAEATPGCAAQPARAGPRRGWPLWIALGLAAWPMRRRRRWLQLGAFTLWLGATAACPQPEAAARAVEMRISVQSAEQVQLQPRDDFKVEVRGLPIIGAPFTVWTR